MQALDLLMRQGKVRYVGASSLPAWALMKALAAADRHGGVRHAGHQVNCSLAGRDYEFELMPLGRDQGVGAVVWSSLAWGRLTGRVRRGVPLPATSRLHEAAGFGPPVEDERLFAIVDAIDVVAAETGRTVPQVAIAWLLGRPTVATVILGARDEVRLRENLGAVGWSLSAE